MEAAGYTGTLISPYGLAYVHASSFEDGERGYLELMAPSHGYYSKLGAAAAPGKTAADTLAWLAQSSNPAALIAGSGIPVQHLQQISGAHVGSKSFQDTQPSAASSALQYAEQQLSVQRGNSLGERQLSRGTTATRQDSSTFFGVETAPDSQVQQPCISDRTASQSSPGAMVSPAAFVHSAQQMLLQQQQQMRQLEQQQLLLAKQQQLSGSTSLYQEQSSLAAPAVTKLTAAGLAQIAQHSTQAPCSPRSVRAALGDRAYFSIRSLLLKQQEAFVDQIYELHRLVRVQQMATSESQHEHQLLTKQYSQTAVSQVQRSLSLAGHSTGQPTASAATTAAAPRASKGTKTPAAAGKQAVGVDDRGEAAVAQLPIHAVLLGNLPRTMRAAVSAPSNNEFAGSLDRSRYYAKAAAGLLKPVAVKSVGKWWRRTAKSSSPVGKPAASADASQDKGTACSESRPAGPVMRSSKAQEHQPQSPAMSGGLRQPVVGLDRPSPVAAATAAAPSSSPNAQAAPRTVLDSPTQQKQMPPPRAMLPGVAAQHVAAAAAAKAAASPAGAAAAAGLQTASALNVFRPMPQIDPLFASRFLAGGQQLSSNAAAAAAAPIAAQFDPHSYWMRKHYGGNPAATPAVSAGHDAPTSSAGSGFSHSQSTRAAAAATGGSKQQQQMRQPTARSGSLGEQAAVDPVVAAATPAAPARSSVQWWHDAVATFGEVGLWDPNGSAPAATAAGGKHKAASEGNWYSTKRSSPQHQQPRKKRAKQAHTAAEAAGYASYPQYYDMAVDGAAYAVGGMAHYGYGDAVTAAAVAGMYDGQCGQKASKSTSLRQSASKECSRVRSNRMGSSHQGVSESFCSDNSASSMDNPNHSAAAAGGGAAYAAAADLGADADGVSLLLHMGRQAATAAPPAAGKAASCTAPAVNVFEGSGSVTAQAGARAKQSSDKSAAAVLLSLSASMG